MTFDEFSSAESSSSSSVDSSTTFKSAAARAAALELKSNPQFMTPADLAEHNGTKPDSLLLLALRCSASRHSALILDVSEGDEYYGPGGPYPCLTGRDASRAFSLTASKAEHLHAEMSSATDEEWKVLDDWFNKLSAKYPSVGFVLPQRSPRAASRSSPSRLQEREENKEAKAPPQPPPPQEPDDADEDEWRDVDDEDPHAILAHHVIRSIVLYIEKLSSIQDIEAHAALSASSPQRLRRHACMRSDALAAAK